MSGTFSFLLSALCLALTITHITGFNSTTKEYLRGLVDADLTANPEHIGGFVRLIFHDCVGDACDGCLNTAQEANRGLDVYVVALETIYQNEILGRGYDVSRADWWAVAAIQAIYFSSCVRRRGQCDSYRQEILALNFTTGRVDCRHIPGTPYTDEIYEFPDALWGLDTVLQYFDTAFGMLPDEVVAVMGAHTLGRAHSGASGFAGSWDARPDRLDNQFYVDLLNQMDWTQTATPGNDPKYFWERQEGTRRFIMLNSDMCLAKDLETAGDINASNGQVSCTYATCDPATQGDVLFFVDLYANDESRFLTDFAKAMRYIVENGHIPPFGPALTVVN